MEMTPGLNVNNFYLWDDVKKIVLATTVATTEELRRHIGLAFDIIVIQPEIFQKVRFNEDYVPVYWLQ